ncbi:hypothetical protein H634G_10452 [Metarhizium anisopliae BRIP 53293]|uniref:Uncharacterized protein n=1 Tax=Metarhizium anisopliae BRIP 53293 TaxID=1291518 RepID=A0A0D9NKA2_METAN|nr:hypothetical protein H634G_10452 [Metarhizium anisopliae BRIP 53293]KJK86000.1 hypothetical protein H633G_10167 [Metarhizium anisopliae BRIP 53284]
MSEPYLTWDTSMGDEGYGEAVKEFFEAVLRIPGNGEAYNGWKLGFLQILTETVDEMGGTPGGVFGILLSAFHSTLSQILRTTTETAGSLEKEVAALCCFGSVRRRESSDTYTGGRGLTELSRTC